MSEPMPTQNYTTRETMRGKRKDNNQNEIAAALEAEGFIVFDTSPLGRGFPDLAVNAIGCIVLLEVKDGRGTMTPAEEAFHAAWIDAPVYVVFDAIEAKAACWDALRKRGSLRDAVSAKFGTVEA